MRPEFYDERANINILSERASKEVIHEIGHYFGMNHCYNTWCVMCFSPSVGDIDVKEKYFCDDCKIKLMAKGINIG